MLKCGVCYLVALRGERKKSGGEVGERPMISNKQACGVAVTTLVCVAEVRRTRGTSVSLRTRRITPWEYRRVCADVRWQRVCYFLPS